MVRNSLTTGKHQYRALDVATQKSNRLTPRVLIMENDRPAGAAIEPYLNERAYRKFHRQKINDFYVRDDGMSGVLELVRISAP